jgi:hypothetical protein
MADRPGCVARQAMAAALSNMSEANKKGAPGRYQAALVKEMGSAMSIDLCTARNDFRPPGEP